MGYGTNTAPYTSRRGYSNRPSPQDNDDCYVTYDLDSTERGLIEMEKGASSDEQDSDQYQ